MPMHSAYHVHLGPALRILRKLGNLALCEGYAFCLPCASQACSAHPAKPGHPAKAGHIAKARHIAKAGQIQDFLRHKYPASTS